MNEVSQPQKDKYRVNSTPRRSLEESKPQRQEVDGGSQTLEEEVGVSV